ncbi:MAG: T9SS type A sorting domain-containing protein [Algoriphagus aquaeductus]
MARQSDGKILIGGNFSSFNGTSRNGIARLNTNGSLDTTFNPGSGASDVVLSLGVQSDGKILVGGRFTFFNSSDYSYLVRLNSNGTLDITFSGLSGTRLDGSVAILQIQTDGKVLIGGNFTLYQSTSRNRIARLNSNGTLDTTFNPGGGADNTIISLLFLTDGKILIGGWFNSYNGVTRNNLARINSNGSLDTAFNPGPINGAIRSVLRQSDGKVLIGGDFTSNKFNPGIGRNYFARLNSNGILDASFNSPTGASDLVLSSAIQADDKILIGGAFIFYNGIARNFIARLNSDGSLDPSFNIGTGANGNVSTIYIQPDGKILIGGDFTSYNGTARNRVARLNSDGSLDSSFNPGTGTNSNVVSLGVQSDGKILIGGFFTSYNGIARNRVARLNSDGSLDSSFNPGTGFNEAVDALLIQPDGKILAGGRFSQFQSISTLRIARLNSDGSLDTSFNLGVGLNSFLSSFALQSDGKIILTGPFSAYNGIPINRVARLNPDGSLDTGFNPSLGPNSSVRVSAIQSNGKILIGGDFTSYNGTVRNRIALLNPDGSLDLGFNPGTGTNNQVFTLSLQSDGKIVFGGTFTSYNNVSRLRISRIYGDPVEEQDNQAPVPAVGNLTPFTAQCLVNFSDLPIPTATDNVDGTIQGTTNQSIFPITQQGSHTITWAYTDAAGNSSTQNQTIIVDDTTAPVPTLTTLPTISGQCAVTVTTPPTANDACKGTITGTTTDPLTYDAQGTYTILWTYDDGNGNTATQEQTVIVDDTTAPVPDLGTPSEPLNPNTVDLTFNLVGVNYGVGANNTVYALKTQSEGKILVGGEFTSFNGIPKNRLVRLNQDGTIDESFSIGSGANNFIHSIALQPDGKILVGGAFSSFNGYPSPGIARLNLDGSFDQTFSIGSGFNNAVLSVQVQSNGKILVGGNFSSFNGVGRTAIARLNSDGSLDESFVPAATGINFVYSVGLQNDGKVLLGGFGFARLNSDGSLDNSFNVGSGINSFIHSLHVDSMQRIMLVGNFSTYNGVSRSRIARVLPNGQLDNSFNPGQGADNQVRTILPVGDGKYLIGGLFSSYNGVNKNFIAQINENGSLDQDYSLVAGLNNFVHVFEFQPGGKIIVGGEFTQVQGQNTQRIFRLFDSGSGQSTTNLPDIYSECSVTLTAPTATDDCEGTITGTTTDPTSYSEQGTYTITWTYDDGNGNTSTQTQTVIVDDTTAPVPAVAELPTMSGQCSVTVTAPTANDACEGTITGTTTDPLTYNAQGTYTITWTYDDGNGNTSTQTQTVIVDDTTAPVPAVAELPTISGQCAVEVSAPKAIDACEGEITGTTTDPLTYDAQGTYTITWTYDDGNGNASTQTQTVIVDDTTAPVPAVAELPVISGQCAVTVTAPTANDTCKGTITGTTTGPLTYEAQGTYTITWTYDDGNGNTSTQTQTVIVDDTTAPVPAMAELPTISAQCAVTVDVPTANDACEGTITGTTTDPLTYDTQGTYTITWTYDDGNGNTSTQTQTVIVDDTTAPVPVVAELPTISGQCAVTVTTPTANDACKGTITGTTSDPLTYTTQGTYTITWTYDDGNGNTSTQTQTVIVDDTTAPVPAVAQLPTISGQCAVEITAPKATDACEGEITGTTTDPTSYTEQGTYTITWTYDDGNGNASTQTQTVVVDDTTAPVPAMAELPTISGQCAVEVSAPKAIDACEGEITGTTTDPTSYTEQGTYTITWTYDDGNGNTTTQTQTVIVDDTTAPVPTVVELPTISGQCAVTVTAPSANDDCEGTIIGTTTDPTSYTEQGTYTITWTYDDGNGNTSTQTQTVIVDDTTAPVPTVAELPEISGQCAVTVTAPTANDTCKGTITGTTTGPLTYDAQGTYTITWKYDDGNGNTSTQTQTIIVDDTTAPVPAVAELPVISGQCAVEVSAPKATDACEGEITGTTTDPTSYSEQGTYTITWTYDDGNGNTSTQTQTVIVDDTTAPVPAMAELPVISGQCAVEVTAPKATDACEGEITGTTTDPTSYTEQGTYTITWTYDDGNGNTSTQTQTVIVDDTTAPVPAVADLPIISGQCAVEVSAPKAIDACAGEITGTTTDPTSYAEQGTYTITWTYDDGNGNSVTQQQTVIVSDVTKPTWSTTLGSLNRTISCGQSNLLAQAQLLAPIASDNCSIMAVEKTAGVFVPSDPNGAGTITNTWIARDVNSNLSEVFTQVITVEGIQIDASSSSTPVRLGTAATLSASVLPVKSDVTVKFYLDGNLVGSDETDGSGLATVSVSGLALDVYKVTAVVGDACAESVAYLPVYDPNGNFVTGGGWINSPQGALIGTSTVGRANFGFVSKYKKGSNQVDGNTEFQFSAGNLNFKSTLHEAGTLVISGRKATYRGDGTVNGVPGYKFTITAIDGHWNGGTGPDQFRIKIWGSSGILYDNGLEADDNSDVATSLGGGSIVIHESKAKGNKRILSDLITVEWNTPLETIQKELDQQSADWFEGRQIPLTLDQAGYDPLTPGLYVLNANLAENEWFELDGAAQIQVLVKDKPFAIDIMAINSKFGQELTAGAKVADLKTIDPVDQIHFYNLTENDQLELRENQLIWKGGSVPAQLTFKVSSTDRAGQTITREITLNKELKIGEFLIYPNPAEDRANVLVELDRPSQVSLRVYDAVGRVVISDQFTREATFVQTLDVNGLAPGMYTVQVQVGKMVMTGRLIKK